MPRPDAAQVRRSLDRLRALALDPAARAAFALELIEQDPGAEVLGGALPALAAYPRPESRERLAALYAAYDAPKRDPGGFIRAAIVDALRPVVVPGDIPLLERAATTAERTPQDPAGCSGLRAAALVVLADADPDLAAFHATTVLAAATDLFATSEMNGEPAVTAARVLGALGHVMPLLLAVRGIPGLHPEVLTTALGELRDIPDAILRPLLRDAANGALVRGDPGAFRLPGSAEAQDLPFHLGLADLLVRHEPTAPVLEAAAAFLRAPRRYEVYRYFVASIVAERHPGLLAALAASAEAEPDRQKLAILQEQLAVRRGDPAIAPLLASVEARLASWVHAPPPPPAEDDDDDDVDPDG
ncbi:MAG: hypothetical protein IT303_17875 [Dehalococcoidia bacterium]|nr:hypothetical protein [Dehalococcoidia bacterium]